jgi:hypothetical protein
MTLNEYLIKNNIDCERHFKLDLSVKNLLIGENLLFMCKSDGKTFKDLNIAEYYVHTTVFNNFFFLDLKEIYNNIEVYNSITYIRYKKLKQILNS